MQEDLRIVVRFVRDGSVTEVGDLATPYFRDIESGLHRVGIEENDLADERLGEEFGADLGALGWSAGGRTRGPGLAEATMAAVFFVSGAAGQWLIEKTADRIVSAIRPAVRRLTARLKREELHQPSPDSVRLTTDVWVADGGRRVTVSVRVGRSDDRPVDEMVAGALARALASVRPGQHLVEEVGEPER